MLVLKALYDVGMRGVIIPGKKNIIYSADVLLILLILAFAHTTVEVDILYALECISYLFIYHSGTKTN